MKKILFLFLLLPLLSFAQPCADEDTVRNTAVSLITYNSARINGSITHFAAPYVTIALKYVRVGFTDTVTTTGLSPLRNITGLQPNTLYFYYYQTICASGTRSNTGVRTFTTLTDVIAYANERATQFPYLKADTGFMVPRQDTLRYRAPNLGGSIVWKPSDQRFYGYNGTYWLPLAIDSAGIIALLDGKVDSVTTSGYQIFYWKNGVSYGFTIPTETDGNLIYVDDVNGNDGTGEVNKPDFPYLTLAAAKAAATSGYTIVVRPGTYSISASLAKDEVDWYFDPGAVVTMASDVDSTGIFDDGGTAMTFIVRGAGKFTRSTTDDFLGINLVNVSHASSNIVIEADELITVGGTDGECSVIRQSSGKVNINSRLITQTGGNSYAVWWFNGSMFIKSSKIEADYTCFLSNVNATPTGDCNIQSDEIISSSPSGGTLAIASNGTNTDAAFWVQSNIIKGKIYTNALSGNKAYVNCQKVFGQLDMQGPGQVFINTDKITDMDGGILTLGTTAGVVRLNVKNLDPSTFDGEVTVAGGTLQLNGADYTGSATADGFVISGGTAILTDCNFNTSANSGTSPITKSGGTLTIRNNILTGEGTVNGISAPTSQTVISYGSVSNRPLDSDVVLSGDIVANSLSYSSNIASGVGTRALRYNPTTEQITYADTTAGGGGTPAGSNTEIQFNNAGAFGANSNFTLNTSDVLMNFNAGNSTGNIKIGSLATAPAYGAIYFGKTTPSTTNWSFLGSTTLTAFNTESGNNLEFRAGNVAMGKLTDATWGLGYLQDPISSVGVTVGTANAAYIKLRVKGYTAQSVDIFEVTDVSNNPYLTVGSAGLTSLTHLKGSTSTPSIAGGAGAGTAPTVSIAGTDLAGEITVTTDSDPASSAVFCTVTFATAFGAAPYVVFSASNANAADDINAGATMYVNSTTTTFTLNVNTIKAPAAGTQFKFTYHVIQ